MAALDAARISVSKPVFEPLVGAGFKCSGCRNAMDAVLVRLDAQSVTQGYSPTKRIRQTQRVDKDERGSRLESRCGSTGSRTELWDFSRQDNNTMQAAVDDANAPTFDKLKTCQTYNLPIETKMDPWS